LFNKEADYLAFERVMREAHQRHPLKLLDWCLMPNHWHFVVWPDRDSQVTAFFRWLTHTHAVRSIAHRRVMGMGALYQGRFKSLPVQTDEHLLTLLRYVERNPVRGKLARRAGLWRWGSEGVRAGSERELQSMLCEWLVDRSHDWAAFLEEDDSPRDSEAIRLCVRRSRPFGDLAWTARTAERLHLSWTLGERGRPRLKKEIDIAKRGTSGSVENPQ
jgi:putative transposase